MLRYQWEDAVRFGIQRKERNCRLVKKLDTFNFLTLHIGRKMNLL
ncbi:hypothetical protein Gotur_008493 [Gossypium turneri]